MIKGCKGKVSGITKNDGEKEREGERLARTGREEADRELAFIPESASKYLCFCGWDRGSRLRGGGGVSGGGREPPLRVLTLH